MKDEILKFRKICDILRKDKGYKNPKLIADIGVSEPTFYKLINSDVNELKIQASVLGLVQDFNKKHRDDVTYAGLGKGMGIESPADTKEKKPTNPEPSPREITMWMERTGTEIELLKEQIRYLKSPPTATLEHTATERREIPIDIEIRINGKRIEF